MKDESPRLLIVEDDARVATVIRAVLSESLDAELEVADSVARAEELVASVRPTLILVDLGLPDGHGADLIRTLRERGFRGPILVLTSSTSDQAILAALRAGADGYLFKEDLDARLAMAVRDLAKGGVPLSPGAAKVVLRELQLNRTELVAPGLTPRETAVLRQLAMGSGYAETARELDMQLNTVRTHVRSLYHKLGVENRAEAVNLAWSMGLLRD